MAWEAIILIIAKYGLPFAEKLMSNASNNVPVHMRFEDTLNATMDVSMPLGPKSCRSVCFLGCTAMCPMIGALLVVDQDMGDLVSVAVS